MKQVIERSPEEFKQLENKFAAVLDKWKAAAAEGNGPKSEKLGLEAVHLADQITRSLVVE